MASRYVTFNVNAPEEFLARAFPFNRLRKKETVLYSSVSLLFFMYVHRYFFKLCTDFDHSFFSCK